MVGDDKGEAGEQRHEQKDDERVGKRDQKTGHHIVYQRTLAGRSRADGFRRIATVSVPSEKEEHDTARHLQVEHVVFVFNEVYHETHSESRNQSIYDVAESCSDSCDEAIPAPFVQCTLNAKHSDWSHGSGCHHADEQSLYD